MSEFVRRIRKHAALTLLRMFQQNTTADADPILELIGFLLEDGLGSVRTPLNALITAEQWQTWNQLALECQDELSRAVTRLLEREQLELPTETTALGQWAVSLVLSALDHLRML